MITPAEFVAMTPAAQEEFLLHGDLSQVIAALSMRTGRPATREDAVAMLRACLVRDDIAQNGN